MTLNFININKLNYFIKIVIIFLTIFINVFSDIEISNYTLKQNKDTSYNLKVFDKKNKIVYKEKFEEEPFIEVLDKHIIRITMSAGSSLNYTYFYNIISQKESDVYENILLVDNSKIVFLKEKKLIVSDYMGEKIYFNKVIESLADTAVQSSAIISVKFIKKNKIEIIYLNNNFEEIKENFELE